jgi:hypothetical protein
MASLSWPNPGMRSTLNRISGVIIVASAFLVSAPVTFSQTAPRDKKFETPGCGPRVWIEYTDDDPDYFIIKNRSPKGWTLEALAIDLLPSMGNLVFDTDEGGKGVGGAAPFYPDAISPVRLIGTVPAQDGGRTIGLQFKDFLKDRDYTFHVDLDAPFLQKEDAPGCSPQTLRARR